MKKFVAFLTVALLHGVPAFAAPSSCDALAGNLVQNCGFETGNLNSWTTGGNASFIGVLAGVQNSGTYGAFLGPLGADGTLSQTLTTVPGGGYTFGFYLDNSQAAGGPSDFSASWDGTVLYSVTNPAAFPYTQFSFAVTGTGSDTILFSARNDSSFFYLDDVSVVGTSVPEPSTLLLLATSLLGAVTLFRLQGNRFFGRN